MYVISERLNSTAKNIRALMDSHDPALAAIIEEQSHADAIDVNCDMCASRDEAFRHILDELAHTQIRTVAADSADPAFLVAAAHEIFSRGFHPIVNSVTASARLHECADAIAETGAHVIVLPMRQRLPESMEEYLDCAGFAAEELQKSGVARDKIYADALISPLVSDSDAARGAIDRIAAVKAKLGLKTVAGISNLSFGLPARALIARTFLSSAAMAGLDAAILDPAACGMRETIAAISLISGGDAMDFIEACRK